jgi:hypothetical protein
VAKKQSKELMSSYLKRFCFRVMTEKLKCNQNDNIRDDESWGKFIYDKAYLKKHNKHIVFKYIEGLKLNLNVFKHIYNILCPVISNDQSLKFYNYANEYKINVSEDENYELVHLRNKMGHYVAKINDKSIAVFNFQLYTNHNESQMEFYKSAILNHNKDYWLYTLWYLEGEYDYVDTSVGEFYTYENDMIESIESYGDTFDKSKLVEIYEKNDNNNKIKWMYYKNNKEFIIVANYDQKKVKINYYYVDTLKLTGNVDNNIYDNVCEISFLPNTMCIKKSNKNIIFKIIHVNLPINVFKLYYPLLMVGNDDCVLKHYKSGSDLKNHIYDCMCCTKSNTKFINFNSLADKSAYFVAMNNNDPLAVLEIDNANNYEFDSSKSSYISLVNNGVYDSYKSSYISSINNANNMCIICYTE